MFLHLSKPSFASYSLALLTACVFGFSSAGCSDGGSADNNAENNGVCQYDCFADYRCENGIVYEKRGGPILCSNASSAQQASEMCANRDETELRTCAEGCRSDIDNISQYPSYTPELCVEDRLARPGDTCDVDDDCNPTDVGVGPMQCEGGTCVDPDAPQDAGMNDAGDAGDDEDTSVEDTEDDTSTEDVVDDTEPDDTGADDSGTEDTSTEDAAADDSGTTEDATSGDTADDDASDASNDDATD